MPFDGVAAAQSAVGAAWRRGMAPPPRRSCAVWADAERRLGPTEGPFPGRWETSRTPYLREPMEAMTLSHPSRQVDFMGSAQVGKTQAPLCLFGQMITETPAMALLVLPSIDEARSYNRAKLQPLLENSPAVAKRILPVQRADDTSSTMLVKKFPGGSIELTGANSSKGLQMRSVRLVVMEEISEFPTDVDNRGDPVDLAEKRLIAFQKARKAKSIAVSTPGMKGACRITARYEAGSRGVFMVPCPHCETRQELKIVNLRWDEGSPNTAAYHCSSCGAACQERDKAGMLAGGKWVHERPELINDHPTYRINALYSPFVTWGWVAQQAEKVKADPTAEKVFIQQVLGEAYEPKHDVIAHQVLFERRSTWAEKRIPPGVLFLTGATDVQGDRLEWAVYGFDRHMTQTWIDGGVLIGDPRQPDVWAEHDTLLVNRWRDAWGRDWPAESWGIDSGYLSQDVYRYVRRHAHRGQPRTMALDGRPRWNLPPIGTARPVDVDYNGKKIGAVLLWPVGTWDVKSELAAAMALTQEGPNTAGQWPKGCMRFPAHLDIGFFEQLTAETLVKRNARLGVTVQEWVKIRARNEQLDLAVYARALARHETNAFDDADWDRLTGKRVMTASTDLVALMQGALAAGIAEIPPPAVPEPQPAPAPRAWVEHHDWFDEEN